MAVNLTAGAISKLINVKGQIVDLKLVLQVIDFHGYEKIATPEKFTVTLSDGSFHQQVVLLHSTLNNELVGFQQLQKGSIVQLNECHLDQISGRPFIIILERVNVIVSKCDIIGDPIPFHRKMYPVIERSTPEGDHADHTQQPLQASTQNCSCSQTESIKQKGESSILLQVAEDISKITRMMMEKNKEDDMGACIEKLDKTGWNKKGPLYNTALLLFGESADHRKLWLHLKPECCFIWVLNVGRKFGPLQGVTDQNYI